MSELDLGALVLPLLKEGNHEAFGILGLARQGAAIVFSLSLIAFEDFGFKDKIESLEAAGAWQKLDIEQYLAQLHPNVEQTFLKKSGERVSRRFDEIESRRRQQFPRLNQVDVINYEVMYQGGSEEEATFGVRYSMDFHFSDREQPIREHNKKECYKVRFNSEVSRWQIIRNDDYLKRICTYE